MKIKKTSEEVRTIKVAKTYTFSVENKNGDTKEFMYECYTSDDEIFGWDSDESWYWKKDKDNMWVVIDFKVEEEIAEWLGEDLGWEDLQDNLIALL